MWIGGGGRCRRIANLLDVGRPSDGEALFAPDLLEQRTIGPLRDAVDHTGSIAHAHFHRVERRRLCLFRGGIIEPHSGRPHVPEIAADEIALACVVMQRRRERRIGVGLRFSLAIARADRTRIGNRGRVEFGNRSGETGFRHVAEGTCFVPVNRKLLVVHQQFAEQQRPLRRIVRTAGESRQGFGLDPVDFGHHPRNFTFDRRRQRFGCRVAALRRCVGAHPCASKDARGPDATQCRVWRHSSAPRLSPRFGKKLVTSRCTVLRSGC
jgi:hypothetical protein